MPAVLRSLARFAAPGFCFFWAAACGQDRPVATVNGEAISRAELAAQVRVFQSVRPGSADDAATRTQVLDQLVKQRLLLQAARREGLHKDPARQAAIAERRRSLRQELERSIADLQSQLDSLDSAVETRLLIDAYTQLKRPGLTVTAKDLRAAYELRTAREPLPPLESIRDQLLEQVIVDRLVEQARAGAAIKIEADALR